MIRQKSNKQNDLIQDKQKACKMTTHCTQAPLGFHPLGFLNKNGHGMHARYLGKTKQNKRSQSRDDAIKKVA